MWGKGQASRKRTLFMLLALFAGLYIVLAILPRRRNGRRSAAPHQGTSAPRDVAPVPTPEPAAEPPSEEEPAELPFAEALSIPDPVAAPLPPVAALAGERATRRARSRSATALVSLTLFAVLALIAAIPSAIGSHGSPYIDLTTVGASVTHDGAIFSAGVGPAGTGQFDPFLTVSPGGSTPTEVGYNSDGQGPGAADDDVFYGGDRTHTLRASAIPPTVVGGVEYREFSLDGNDQGSDDFMSIDNVELYIDTEAGVKGYTDGAGCTPGTFSVNTGPAPAQIYCLDASGNETILMKTQGLSSGSGQSDITILIPASIFPAECFYGSLTCNKWVTYYFEAGFAGPLAAGAGCTGTCNYDVTAGFEEWRTRKLPVVSVTKTVTASINRKFDWTVKKYVSTDDTCTTGFIDAQTAGTGLDINLFNGQSDTICWQIVSDRGDPTLSGGVISGSIEITNPTGGDVITFDQDAVLNDVTDIVVQGGPPVGATVTCPFTFPHTLDPQDTVTCTYTKPTSSAAPGTNTAHAFVDNGTNPDLDYPSPTMPFTVTTTDEDENASLDDSRSLPNAPILLTGDDARTYTEVLSCPSSRTELNIATLTETDTSTVHTDPAYVNVNCNTLSVSKTATATYNRAFDWTVKKYVTAVDNCSSGLEDDTLTLHLFTGQSETVCWKIVSDRGDATDSGFKVTGTITITNSAPIAANGVAVSDVLAGPIAATVDCDPVTPGNQATVNIPASSSKDCTYEAFPPDATDRLNTATATLAGNNYTGTALADFGAPTNVEDESATLDDIRDVVGLPKNLSGDDTHTYTEVLTCDADAGLNSNLATLTEDDTGQIRTDPAAVDLTCHGLAVEKTAVPTYKRTFDWTVKKYVSTDDTCAAGFVDDTLSITLDVGDSDTVCWKIVPDRGAGVDSDFKVTGTITITNSAPIPANGVAVTDQLAGPVAATVDCDPGTAGNQATVDIPASSSRQCTYEAFPPDATDRLNTAKATLAGTDYTGTALADFGAPTTVIDESARLDDDRKPSGFPQTFTDTDPDGAPITYTEVLTCGDSRTESNIADLEELDTNVHRTDPAAVDLTCVPVGEGCTPGYWKNHLSSWAATGFSPNQTLESVFDVPDVFGLDSVTLLAALDLPGGSGTKGAAQTLLRAAVAALLNSAHPGVDYPRTTAEVIADVNAALASLNRATMLDLARELDEDNNLGCPLS